MGISEAKQHVAAIQGEDKDEVMQDIEEAAQDISREEGISVDEARQRIMQQRAAAEEENKILPSQFDEFTGMSPTDRRMLWDANAREFDFLASFYANDPTGYVLVRAAGDMSIEEARARYKSDPEFKQNIDYRTKVYVESTEKAKKEQEQVEAAEAAKQRAKSSRKKQQASRGNAAPVIPTERQQAIGEYLKNMSPEFLQRIEQGVSAGNPEIAQAADKLGIAAQKLQEQADIPRYRKMTTPIEYYLRTKQQLLQGMKQKQGSLQHEQNLQEAGNVAEAQAYLGVFEQGLQAIAQNNKEEAERLARYTSPNEASEYYDPQETAESRLERMSIIFQAAGAHPGHAEKFSQMIENLEKGGGTHELEEPAFSVAGRDSGQVDMASAIQAFMEAVPQSAEDVVPADVVALSTLSNLTEMFLQPISEKIYALNQVRVESQEQFEAIKIAPKMAVEKSDELYSGVGAVQKGMQPAPDGSGQQIPRRQLNDPAIASEVVEAVLGSSAVQSLGPNIQNTPLYQHLKNYDIDAAVQWIQNNDWVQYKNFVAGARSQIAATTDIATSSIIEHLIAKRQIEHGQLAQGMEVFRKSQNSVAQQIFTGNQQSRNEATAATFASKDGLRSFMIAQALIQAKLTALSKTEDMTPQEQYEYQMLQTKENQMQQQRKIYFDQFGDTGKEYFKKTQNKVSTYYKELTKVWSALSEYRGTALEMGEQQEAIQNHYKNFAGAAGITDFIDSPNTSSELLKVGGVQGDAMAASIASQIKAMYSTFKSNKENERIKAIKKMWALQKATGFVPPLERKRDKAATREAIERSIERKRRAARRFKMTKSARAYDPTRPVRLEGADY
jgi:hypothetical protein